ncbi:UDP-N-acetylmuramate dehydrogenase [Candidatus Kaiserbacteria bacterium]|nr:UDP-N-acetylmuramate dehydrogenase [Candidatus Kaiserbacteria bacterium]
MRLREHVPLAPFTTLSIGGEARWLADVMDEDELREALSFAKTHRLSTHILGGGSNTLFSDAGFYGLVVRMADERIHYDGELVSCASGVSLRALLEQSAGRGLGGLEKLAGIPGSIGGAVRGNAGAFGMEIKDSIESIEALDTAGAVHHFDHAACRFGYRESMFKHEPMFVITRIRLRFQPSRPSAVEHAMADIIAERERKHIQHIKSAGSFFINPVVPEQVWSAFEREGNKSRRGRVPAGWLIERAGMRGVKIGDAAASEHHANYFINTGDATALDVLALVRLVKASVLKRDDVRLQEEVTVV